MGTTILTKQPYARDEDIDICLRFEDSRGRIRFNRNSPKLVEEGVKRYIRRELGL